MISWKFHWLFFAGWNKRQNREGRNGQETFTQSILHPLGWAISERINRKLVKNALMMAIGKRRPKPGLIFHSDRGIQYCSAEFQKLLKDHHMICSMSRKGDCWDNAVAESFFASLKTERAFYRKYRTREQARQDIVNYIEMFYNSRRLHSYLGYLSPRDFENLQTLKKVA